jgi:Domain of unknown function (DUF4394)
MRLNFKLFNLGAFALAGLLLSTGCADDEALQPQDDSQIESRGLISGVVPNTALIGLSPNNELVNLMSGPPAQDLGVVPITGLRAEEFVLAIDTRPRTKQLYGVTNFSTIYVIDKVSGAALPVGASFSPVINGAMVGFDFSPVDDLIRLITDAGQCLRISPVTGAVTAVDVLLNPNQVPINSVAFSTSLGTQRSTLYDLDTNNGNMYRQSSANGGTLTLVGPTGFLFSGDGGFEITSTNTAFTVQFGKSRFPSGFGTTGFDDITQESHRLLNINLRTGKATSFGKVRPMIGLAVN